MGRLRAPGRSAATVEPVAYVRVVDAALSVVSASRVLTGEDVQDVLFALDAVAADVSPQARGIIFDALASVGTCPVVPVPEFVDLLLDLRNVVDAGSRSTV